MNPWQNFKWAIYTSVPMSSAALLKTGIHAARLASYTSPMMNPERDAEAGGAQSFCQRHCPLRATIALWICLSGGLLSLVFALLAKSNDEGTGPTGLFIVTVVFLVLAVMSFFQRSLEKQIRRFDEENDELRETRSRLDEENQELKSTRDRLDQENKEFDAANRKYVASNETFTRQLAEQEENLQHLNKLHNDSVAMIRQLAMYGDECKDFGKDLKEISGDLKETDDSLGLSADELRPQTAAIKAATDALVRASGQARSSTA